jgi:hypothetical protein
MATEFSVSLQDRPGTLAQLGSALGNARVNIEAILGIAREGQGRIQFVANDRERAAQALSDAGIPYTTREVVIVRVLDEPGTLGDVALVMAKADINIDSVYVTTRGHVVLGVDDVAGAVHVAASMAVMDPE